MKSKKLEAIIQEYLNGRLTETELKALIGEFTEKDIRMEIEESVKINYLLSKKYISVDSKAAFVDFLSRTRAEVKSTAKIPKRHPLKFLKYAAVFVGIIIASFLLWTNGKTAGNTANNQIDGAITLQLNDGNARTIDPNGSVRITDGKGRTIAEQKGDTLIYTSVGPTEKLTYNELKIPYGKRFQVALSDGTLVYLNAGTTLKYPTAFIKGQHREVFVQGEAYFKVAEDAAHPFIVKSGKLNVRVLGTRFNVSSYGKDDTVSTVLVSGKVHLYGDGTEYDQNTATDLQPGRMAKWDKQNKTFSIQKVDTEIYTGWIEGKLIFKDMPFKTIREKLERHYDVKIVNNNQLLEANTFNARFDIEGIEEVMEAFRRNFGIQYTINENQITID
tara:strand:+ start:5862 stop:7025 length:1164 start_codon:yes stop_codon:yes gene_type:complete